VYAENGICIGFIATSEIVDFDFEDIKYIGIGVWGYSPADYSFRNIQNSLDRSASNITITTQSSSTTAGATVDVFGALTDGHGLKFPANPKPADLYF
jgi:hypothetical protein